LPADALTPATKWYSVELTFQGKLLSNWRMAFARDELRLTTLTP
jgi:hypothetical protein